MSWVEKRRVHCEKQHGIKRGANEENSYISKYPAEFSFKFFTYRYMKAVLFSTPLNSSDYYQILVHSYLVFNQIVRIIFY